MAKAQTPQPDDEQLLQWAEQFIEEIARGQHDDLANLDDLTSEQKVALAQLVEGAMEHETPAIRCAGAWVLSQIDVMPEDAPEVLCSLLHDPTDEVRRAAAWAFSHMPDEAIIAVDDLVELLSDPDDGVKLAAMEALAQIGEPAKAAVPRLLAIARATSAALRGVATKALSRIAPAAPEVQAMFVESLTEKGSGDAFFATVGLAQAGSSSSSAAPLVAANLNSPDHALALLSGWTLGRIGSAAFDAVPGLLGALSRLQWMPIELSELGEERIDIRPDMVDSLHGLLPSIDDDEYDDFRRLFLHRAFHPSSVADQSWIAKIIEHPWYLKLQRARFPHPSNPREAQERQAAIQEAQRKLFNRLLKNPTLGLPPADYRLFPGFLKMHTRNIAWSIARSRHRQIRRDDRTALEAIITSQGSFLDDLQVDDMRVAVCQFIEHRLPKEQSLIFKFRFHDGWTLAQIAQVTGLTESQVKTRLKHAQRAVEQWLRAHG